jgi:hypothetical protein
VLSELQNYLQLKSITLSAIYMQELSVLVVRTIAGIQGQDIRPICPKG